MNVLPFYSGHHKSTAARALEIAVFRQDLAFEHTALAVARALGPHGGDIGSSR